MLPKKHRLAKALEVKRTTARGRSFFNPHAVVKYLKGSGPARLTVVTSTKVSKKAVVRNRVKRIVREAVRSLLPQLQSGEYVIIMKAAAANVSAKTLRSSVVELFEKTKLIK
jgi:ribonuclease P protein component